MVSPTATRFLLMRSSLWSGDPKSEVIANPCPKPNLRILNLKFLLRIQEYGSLSMRFEELTVFSYEGFCTRTSWNTVPRDLPTLLLPSASYLPLPFSVSLGLSVSPSLSHFPTPSHTHTHTHTHSERCIFKIILTLPVHYTLNWPIPTVLHSLCILPWSFRECLSAGENIENSKENLGWFLSNDSFTSPSCFFCHVLLEFSLAHKTCRNGKTAFSLAMLCAGCHAVEKKISCWEFSHVSRVWP